MLKWRGYQRIVSFKFIVFTRWLGGTRFTSTWTPRVWENSPAELRAPGRDRSAHSPSAGSSLADTSPFCRPRTCNTAACPASARTSAPSSCARRDPVNIDRMMTRWILTLSGDIYTPLSCKDHALVQYTVTHIRVTLPVHVLYHPTLLRGERPSLHATLIFHKKTFLPFSPGILLSGRRCSCLRP